MDEREDSAGGEEWSSGEMEKGGETGGVGVSEREKIWMKKLG